MSSLFSGPPKAPPLPKMPSPNNPQLNAEAAQQAKAQGAAASVLTTNKSSGASLFGS